MADLVAHRLKTKRIVHRVAEALLPVEAPPSEWKIIGYRNDVDSAEREVLALGATRVTDAVGENYFRVFRDPAGHTFCLVWGIAD